MPWYAGVRSVVYRTDVFEKAGVEPPTTWDELVAVGEKIKAADPDMITFPVAGDSEYGVDPFIWGNGGEIATQDGDDVDEHHRLPRGPGGHQVLHRPRPQARLLHARPRPRGTRPTSPTRSPARTSR